MAFETWIAFALASSALLAIPGPTVLIVVSYAMARGRWSAWQSVPGVALGDLTAMTLSVAGAGAVLAASATLFSLLKVCGALYLIWIAIGLWRASGKGLQPTSPESAGRSVFWRCYTVTALNPKSIVFFIAFVPQFVTRDTALVPQLTLMIVTFVLLAAVNTLIWVMAADGMRTRFSKPPMRRVVERVGAVFMFAAGLLTLMTRRI